MCSESEEQQALQRARRRNKYLRAPTEDVAKFVAFPPQTFIDSVRLAIIEREIRVWNGGVVDVSIHQDGGRSQYPFLTPDEPHPWDF